MPHSPPRSDAVARSANGTREGIGASAVGVSPFSIENTAALSEASGNFPLIPRETRVNTAGAPPAYDPRIAAPRLNLASAERGARLAAIAGLRAQRHRDLLASIEEYRRATGPDRRYWRRVTRHQIAEWKLLHTVPERAAFQAAVAASRQRTRSAA